MSFKWLLESDALHHSYDGVIFVKCTCDTKVSHFANRPCPLVLGLEPAVKRQTGKDQTSLDPQ